MGKDVVVTASVRMDDLSDILYVGDLFLILKNWSKPALVELKSWLDDFLANWDDAGESLAEDARSQDYDLDEIASLLTLDDICDLLERLKPRQQEFVYTWMKHSFAGLDRGN